jgi:uncharacterized membrane protein
MGTIRKPMTAMSLMDVLMSGENFKNVNQMLKQMEAFVEKTEQDLKQGRERVGKLRNQYNSLKQNEAELTQQRQAALPSEPKLETAVQKQPTAAPVALSAQVPNIPTKRVLRATQPSSEPQQETDTQYESRQRTYLRK